MVREVLDLELISSIAQQLMTSAQVKVRGKLIPVRRTSAQRLRRVTFAMNGREYEAIEQNPEKPSRWGQLAREGHQVVQFKDNSDQSLRRCGRGWKGEGVRFLAPRQFIVGLSS